jgi:hypothetical protein
METMAAGEVGRLALRPTPAGPIGWRYWPPKDQHCTKKLGSQGDPLGLHRIFSNVRHPSTFCPFSTIVQSQNIAEISEWLI